jgi:hypothetical protein
MKDGRIELAMAGSVKDRFLIPGRVYRDVDGSLVHLVAVERDLCTWVAITDAEKNRQVTHRDNFRQRFRSFENACQSGNKKAA